jgi:hypothetical protein
MRLVRSAPINGHRLRGGARPKSATRRHRRLISKSKPFTLLLPEASLPQPIEKVVDLTTELRIT